MNEAGWGGGGVTSTASRLLADESIAGQDNAGQKQTPTSEPVENRRQWDVLIGQ